MPRESHETPYGICWSNKEITEGPPCKEIITGIGANELADYDESVLTKPYALEAWNYIIKQVNNLIICGQDHGLVPVFDVLASEINPHVWTIRDMHDILSQICPEIMAQYGNKPLMWDRAWLETVIAVLRNGWCQVKETEITCEGEPEPSTPPPAPYKLALNIVVSGEVTESYAFSFPAACYHYKGRSAPMLWTSEMAGAQYSMYSGPNTATLCATPRCSNQLTGYATIAVAPGFNPETGEGAGVIVTTTMSGPNGTYSRASRGLQYPSFHCNGPYTAMSGFINVAISAVVVYR